MYGFHLWVIMKAYPWFTGSTQRLTLTGTSLAGILPPNLIELDCSFCGGIDFNLKPGILPDSLTVLCLPDGFNGNADHLPPFLTHLTMGHHFNNGLDHLPMLLKYLITGNLFNRTVDCLPASLVSLQLGRSFDKKIDHLPPGLTELKLYSNFSHAIDRLPASLTSLCIGNYHHTSVPFLHPLDSLPTSLTDLSIQTAYSLPLDFFTCKAREIVPDSRVRSARRKPPRRPQDPPTRIGFQPSGG